MDNFLIFMCAPHPSQVLAITLNGILEHNEQETWIMNLMFEKNRGTCISNTLQAKRHFSTFMNGPETCNEKS